MTLSKYDLDYEALKHAKAALEHFDLRRWAHPSKIEFKAAVALARQSLTAATDALVKLELEEEDALRTKQMRRVH